MPELDAVEGTVSVWCARLDAPPAVARLADVEHYAASTMKVAVLAAAYRLVEAGRLDLDAAVPVVNEFASSAPGAPAFACTERYDNDPGVWAALGREVRLRWLADRMITRSSNLATNLVLDRVGRAAVAEAWRAVGARHSVVGRGIEDAAARDAGITNTVTAADLGALLSAVVTGPPLVSTASSRAMLATLEAQRGVEDLAAGLPPGTRIAHKNGWVMGARHGAGVIFPADAPPYVLAVCATTPLARNDVADDACALLARIAAASWRDRHDLAPAMS
ncbi:serine hydrolase [Luedemannella helvata]